MSLQKLTLMSNVFGSDKEYVLAGGGNTSYKDDKYLYIKGSGTALATIKAEQFVIMEKPLLDEMWTKAYSADDAVREKEVLDDLMFARAKGQTSRPSVETLLHALFEQKFVLHVHPSLVNGITCAVDGEKVVAELFPNSVWVPASKPGYVLALLCKKLADEYKAKNGKSTNMLFLQNHGIFIAADTTEEIDAEAKRVMALINSKIGAQPSVEEKEGNISEAAKVAPIVRMAYKVAAGTQGAICKYLYNDEIEKICQNEDVFKKFYDAFTPDHIVYCKASPLFVAADKVDAIPSLIKNFAQAKGFVPKIVCVEKLGIFVVSATLKEVLTACEVFVDELKVAVYTESFGGFLPMPQELTDFIVNWEVESYRQKTAFAGGADKRLEGKIVIVTGSAQGFGEGIARELAAQGANLVIADMNKDGAAKVAADLCAKHGAGRAISLFANVSDEASVEDMINRTVVAYGGLDIFVNNAGIVRAGSLEEMTKSNFELVTSVNYTAYFLCTKYASRPMKLQHQVDPDYLMDVIEINSKSGLEGSNKNFAYAGGKFGGIGLTQSFALELVEYGIKVNAVCPGNFLGGPLWMDPEKGLFVQYLKAGKVPGAKTVEDVKKFYESKVPMNRGCETIDVARAILYIVEQTYETGQAIPVTGGQVMLK